VALSDPSPWSVVPKYRSTFSVLCQASDTLSLRGGPCPAFCGVFCSFLAKFSQSCPQDTTCREGTLWLRVCGWPLCALLGLAQPTGRNGHASFLHPRLAGEAPRDLGAELRTPPNLPSRQPLRLGHRAYGSLVTAPIRWPPWGPPPGPIRHPACHSLPPHPDGWKGDLQVISMSFFSMSFASCLSGQMSPGTLHNARLADGDRPRVSAELGSVALRASGIGDLHPGMAELAQIKRIKNH
jgi:hypothetical protein